MGTTLRRALVRRLDAGSVNGAVVWSVWAAACGLFLLHVAWYASKLPSEDDLWLVPYVTGAEPVTATWLWDAFSQHRMPLPKLLLVGLTAPTQSFLPAKLFNWLLLAASSGGVLLLTRRLRGRSDPCDAAVPIALLSLSQAELWWTAHALNLALGATLIVGVLLAVARSPRVETPRAFAALAGLILALPLCGMVGVAFAPALVPWLLATAVSHWRGGTRPGRRFARAFVGLATATVALCGAYAVGLHLPPQQPEPLAERAPRLAGQFARLVSLSTGLTSPDRWRLAAAAVAVPTLAALGLCLATAGRARPERLRTLGLLCWLAGWAVLLFGVAWGRSGWWELFLSRYVTLAVPVNAWVAVVVALRGRGAWRLIPLALTAAQVFCLPRSLDVGTTFGVTHAQLLKRFEYDIKGSVPVSVLAEQYANALFFGKRDELAARLRELRAAGWDPFGGLPADEPFEEETVALTAGDQVRLGPATRVAAVRFTYETFGVGPPGELAVTTDGTPTPRTAALSGRAGGHTALVWCDAECRVIAWAFADGGRNHRVTAVTLLRRGGGKSD